MTRFSPRFWAYWLAVSLEALNDNAYKFTVQLFLVERARGEGREGFYLAAVLAFFTVPFLLFAGYAGWVADRFRKDRVIRWTKGWEVGTMLLALWAFAGEQVPWMLGVLFLVTTQSAFLGPAKYGILPEWFDERMLIKANGWVQMGTYLAIILGSAAGGAVMHFWGDRLVWAGGCFVVLALAGWLASLWIPPASAPGPARIFTWNPWAGIRRSYGVACRDRRVWGAVLALGYFMLLGGIYQSNLVLYAERVLGLGELHTGGIQALLGIALGLGSLAAGYAAREVGSLRSVWVGVLGMGLCSLGLFGVPAFFGGPLSPPGRGEGEGGLLGLVCLFLAGLGVSGGLYLVPLNALLQHRSPPSERGGVLAFSSFVSFSGVLLASGCLWLLLDGLNCSAPQVFLVMGGMTLVGGGMVRWMVRP
jgi:MFS family permease